MSHALAPYLTAIRHTLNAALCLSNFPSQHVERHNKPEVEIDKEIGPGKPNELYSRELHLQPVTIARNENEKCMIEPSINSVRVSICIKKADEIETILCKKFTRFLMQRADNFIILRRKPIEGFDLSFLITNVHLEDMYKQKLIDFVIQFMEDIDKEINEMKLAVNARARISAGDFMKRFVQ
eukprot:GILI01007913.1.p1 GENE.GILI01007913.1~~GILI01007913.1.p1  ORF type:complete len:182 (-),score=35.80 GILI01007913.1:170-715(-)